MHPILPRTLRTAALVTALAAVTALPGLTLA